LINGRSSRQLADKKDAEWADSGLSPLEDIRTLDPKAAPITADNFVVSFSTPNKISAA